MDATTYTWRTPHRRLPPHEATSSAARLAVSSAARPEQTAPTPAATRGWDEVHHAALDSFPASDAPSWSPLRVGPPASGPRER